MSYRFCIVFLYVFTCRFNTVILSLDPCTNYQPIYMANGLRSSDFYSFDSAILLCDDDVVDGTWYRFEHDAGNRLIETPVDPWHCATQAPIWINGSHPTDSTEKTVLACATYTVENRCAWSGLVRIRLCTAFGSPYYVYRLAVPPGCPLAYCIDAASRKQCDPPEVWISDEFRCGAGSEYNISTNFSPTPTTSVTNTVSITNISTIAAKTTTILSSPTTTILSSSTTKGSTTAPPSLGWSPWGPWSVCSKQCDYGLQSRRRICGQLPCEGPSTMGQLCNQYNCQKIPDEQFQGIILILESFDASEDSLFKVVEEEQIIYGLLRSSLNKVCSKNSSLCCGDNYKSNATTEIEYVTLSDVFPSQGTMHPKPDRTVSLQVIAVVNEDIDRTVCKDDSQRIKTRQVKSSSPHFIPFPTMETALLDCIDRIPQSTGLVVSKYNDPSSNDYDDDNDDSDYDDISDCPPTTCIVPIVVTSVLVVVGIIIIVVVVFMCYKRRRSKPETSEVSSPDSPQPPQYETICYSTSSGSMYDTMIPPQNCTNNFYDSDFAKTDEQCND